MFLQTVVSRAFGEAAEMRGAGFQLSVAHFIPLISAISDCVIAASIRRTTAL